MRAKRAVARADYVRMEEGSSSDADSGAPRCVHASQCYDHLIGFARLRCITTSVDASMLRNKFAIVTVCATACALPADVHA